MPRYHIEESITIDKPLAELRDYLADFSHWTRWSPWLIMERSCAVTYQGTQGEIGAGYHWVGDMVGEGKMRLAEKGESHLKIDLSFLKPFKSTADVGFIFSADGNGTKVTWTMDSKLPFFLFFMKKMMEQSLAMDYQRGLKMLKSLIETGDIPSELSLTGRREQKPMHYVGLASNTHMSELPNKIPADYAKIGELVGEKGIQLAGPPFTLYEGMDMDTQMNQIINGFHVAEKTDVPAPFVSGTIDAQPTYVVEHKGAYPFIGNAWSFAFFAARHHKVKLKKKPVGYEYYLSDPENTAEKDIKTEVVLFAK